MDAVEGSRGCHHLLESDGGICEGTRAFQSGERISSKNANGGSERALNQSLEAGTYKTERQMDKTRKGSEKSEEDALGQKSSGEDHDK